MFQIHNAKGLTQDIVDRAAAIAARPNATQELIGSMAKLSDIYHDVEAMLKEIQELLKVQVKIVIFSFIILFFF